VTVCPTIADDGEATIVEVPKLGAVAAATVVVAAMLVPATTTVLLNVPAATAVPVTVNTACPPAATVGETNDTVFPAPEAGDPPGIDQDTEDNWDGTESVIVAVPAAVPVFFAVIVYVTVCPTSTDDGAATIVEVTKLTRGAGVLQ
jgi:hypothetical protein